MPEQNNHVVHLPEQNRFVIEFEGAPAYLEYEMASDGTFMIMHTEVPPAHSGKGYAATLAEAALLHAEENNMKVMPYCSYMATFLRRHKERYKALASPEFVF
ncbi:GNAT family N-acetyltransferase [Cesiribacter sp. SM1]|uniref:GNAT family N-acetyltransferase n=1 Tax=Cesiribacter sp. SM1 TaxID=2861196 RepID=UPI001CD5B4CC|nr:N-acetyltransferase [Cesiribacter sp. SM1]